MIIYALWLYDVDADRLAEFQGAFREDGIWLRSFRRLSGHIHTDLLGKTENPPRSCRLLSISFFTSLDALLLAEHSAEVKAFVRWLRERANLCIYLGPFSFLPEPEAEVPSGQQTEMHGAVFARGVQM
jgi:hypothetical protein